MTDRVFHIVLAAGSLIGGVIARELAQAVIDFFALTLRKSKSNGE